MRECIWFVADSLPSGVELLLKQIMTMFTITYYEHGLKSLYINDAVCLINTG